MKLTEDKLRQIIKEEAEKMNAPLNEAYVNGNSYLVDSLSIRPNEFDKLARQKFKRFGVRLAIVSMAGGGGGNPDVMMIGDQESILDCLENMQFPESRDFYASKIKRF